MSFLRSMLICSGGRNIVEPGFSQNLAHSSLRGGGGELTPKTNLSMNDFSWLPLTHSCLFANSVRLVLMVPVFGLGFQPETKRKLSIFFGGPNSPTGWHPSGWAANQQRSDAQGKGLSEGPKAIWGGGG